MSHASDLWNNPTDVNDIVGIGAGTAQIGSVTISSIGPGTATIGIVRIPSGATIAIMAGVAQIGSVTVSSLGPGTAQVGSVTVSSIGAGTAQIGSVTVSSLGAGVAQIGSVTVSSLGAGVAQVGSVTVSSIGAGTAQIGSATVSNLNLGTDDSDPGATPKIYLVGGEYRASATTYTDGDAAIDQMDINGNKKSTLATAIAGEDLTNDLLKVEQRYSYALMSGASLTMTVKSGAGFVHNLVVGAISSPSITLYDNTAGSGAIIAAFPASIPVGSYLLDWSFATGLTIMTCSGSTPFLTIGYR